MSKPKDPLLDMPPADDDSWWQALDNDKEAIRHFELLGWKQAFKQPIEEVKYGHDEVRGRRK